MSEAIERGYMIDIKLKYAALEGYLLSMKKALLGATTALTIAGQVQAQNISADGLATLRQLDQYVGTECVEVGGNTRQQCNEILYPYGYEEGQQAQARCIIPRPDEFNSFQECVTHEVLNGLKEKLPEILEIVRSPIGEEI